MRGSLIGIALIAIFAVALAGCANVSKPYIMKMDRVDQDLSTGNKGYLKGTPPPPKDRGDLKRPFVAIDIDLPEGKESPEATVETNRNVTAVKEETPAVVKEKVAAVREEVK